MAPFQAQLKQQLDAEAWRKIISAAIRIFFYNMIFSLIALRSAIVGTEFVR